MRIFDRNMKLFRLSVLSAIAAVSSVFLSGCAPEEIDNRGNDYGYVQFKLYKEASYIPSAKSTSDRLDYLAQASKIKVELIRDEQTISQTLTLSGGENPEFGLRSSKLQLLPGEYQVAGFTLFDAVDTELTRGQASGQILSIISGGLTVYDLTADVAPRGTVRFYLEKDLSGFTPQVKGSDIKRQYTMDEISKIDISVKTTDGTAQRTDFKGLPVKFKTHFASQDSDGNEQQSGKPSGYQTSSSVCDTILSLPAGDYNVVAYKSYDVEGVLLETRTFDKDAPVFEVADNQLTKSKVKVTLNEADSYIQDYYALYAIWKALDGEHWYYEGENWPVGSNWDFNKDPDLWGDQPGVQLHANGRVAKLDLTGFGISGVVPASIGQLTEIVELSFGSHNETKESAVDPLPLDATPEQKQAHRLARHKEYMKQMHPAVQMSAPIALALREHNIHIDEISAYDGLDSDQISKMAADGRIPSAGPSVTPKDMNFGKLTNNLKGIDKAIGKLTKLEQLSIANSPIEDLPLEIGYLSSCTDLELYNCPKLGKLPQGVANMPALVSINMSNNGFGKGDDSDHNAAYQAIDALANGAAKSKIQIIYALQNNLRVIPESIVNIPELSMLDLAHNNIHGKIKPFGEKFSPIEIHLDNNQIEGFEYDPSKKFCRTEDLDVFSANFNRLTEFPNIFTSDTKYTMTSISLAYNQISRFPDNFQGVMVKTLTLSANAFTSFPKELLGTEGLDSYVEFIQLKGNKISEWPEGCFKSKYNSSLISFDLSFNNLSELPSDFNAETFPYLYGFDISFNNFNHVPVGPLNCAGLTVYAIRGQRDKNGERCLRDWYTGLYQHKGLRGFYIGSNDLRKIDDTISTLIYYLDISDNPNITFDASDVCAAWKAGLYILYYDLDQEIINCDEMLAI